MDQNPERVEIRISEVLDMLNEGISREKIGEHFNLNKAETRKLFEHEKLRGKRPKKMPSFTIVDDTVETPVPQEEPTVNLDDNPVGEPDSPESEEEVLESESADNNVVEQETY